MRWQLQTPVAFLIFNRPETTAKVFHVIAKVKPPVLLVVADGPRVGNPDDKENCKKTRAIIEKVDWDCKILTNYSDVNLGCKRRVSTGLEWVFDTVPEAIVLEDDCVPCQTFFRFCEELLQKYREDERVMHISGNNFQFGRQRGTASYYFSRYPHVWGWASWHRAWRHYDVDMKLWSASESKDLCLRAFHHHGEKAFWRNTWDEVWAGKINTWDYQWAFACVTQNGLAIVPNANLVTNIGFGFEATHTSRMSSVANLPVQELDFPLTHPVEVVKDPDADNYTRALLFTKPGFVSGLLIRFLRLFCEMPQRLIRGLGNVL